MCAPAALHDWLEGTIRDQFSGQAFVRLSTRSPKDAAYLSDDFPPALRRAAARHPPPPNAGNDRRARRAHDPSNALTRRVPCRMTALR